MHGSIGFLRELVPKTHLADLNDLARQADYGYISNDEFFERTAPLLGKTKAEVAEIARAQWIRNEQAVELAQSLHASYKIAMLSNIGRGVVNDLFTEKELKELFDIVVLSSEVGIVKPDPAIYELTARELELAPEECIMIDDILRNVEGAKKIGMHGILYESAEQLEVELRTALGGAGAGAA